MNKHPLRKHIEEIIPLTDDQFDIILSHFSPLRKKKHQFIVQEGDYIDKEYWVIGGCLKSCFYDDSGKEHIIQFATENWWITDYDAFLNKTKATISIDCLEDCDLLYITYDNKEKLSQSMHEMERFWSKKTKLGYVALQKRILSLLKNTAKERHDQLLKHNPSLFQRVPKKLLASYLGVSRETLSRF